MDIHDIALSLYTTMIGQQDPGAATTESRLALGRQAYLAAEAFIAAKDVYIRELPVSGIEQEY